MDIVTRADWDAQPPARSYVNIPMDDRPGLETHHSVGLYGTNTPEAFARAVQADHLGRGWTDAFYNYTIWFDGRIIELRPDHAKSGPIEHLTICLPGNYNSRVLTAEQNRAWHQLRAHLRARGGGPEVAWHGQRAAVGCPGATVIGWLRAGHPLPDSGKEHLMNPDLVIYAPRNIDYLTACAIAGTRGGRAVPVLDKGLAQEAHDNGVKVVAIGGPAADDINGDIDVVGVDALDSLIRGGQAAS